MCEVEGCDNPPRSPRAVLCAMHYHRQYRHGSVDRTASEFGSVSPGRRYRSVHRPDHPLAGPSGRVYVHRIALYDKIGTGPHACHWCSTEVDWLPKSDPRHIQVDHLNGIGDDNDPANLVPSCHTCNAARAVQHRTDVLRSAGFWSANDTVAITHPRRTRIERT